MNPARDATQKLSHLPSIYDQEDGRDRMRIEFCRNKVCKADVIAALGHEWSQHLDDYESGGDIYMDFTNHKSNGFILSVVFRKCK